MALAAVPDKDDDDTTRSRIKGLYKFEGKDVKYTKANVTSVAGLEINDDIYKTDEIVKLVVECRVVGVSHRVNEKTGDLERIHTLKAIDCLPVKWEMDLEELAKALT